MTPEQIAQLQRFQAGEELSEEQMAALYPAMVEEQIKRAKRAQTKEFIFNALSQGIRAATGLPFQQSLRNRRLAADAQQRALAREAADQDTVAARTKYFELKQNFIDGIVDAAQASVTPENEAEIKQAELLAQREAKLLEMIEGGDKGEVEKEDTKARMAATRFINAVSRGQSSKNALIGQLSPLNTQYALDRFSYWVNAIARDVEPIDPSENKSNAARINDRFGNQGLDPSLDPGDTQAQFAGLTKNHIDDILTTMGRPDGEGFYDPVEYGGSATLPESYMLDSEYMKQRQTIIDAGTLAPNPGGFSGAQLLVLDTGDVQEAMRRSKEALDDLSDLPGIEQQIKKVAGQNLNSQQLAELGDNYTAGDVFDKISGLTQEEAFAADARTQNEVSQAMDILMRTGDYSPLTGDKRMLNDMQAKGLSPKEYAFFLKNKYDGKQAQAEVFRPEVVKGAIKTAEAEQKRESQDLGPERPSKPATDSAALANTPKAGDPPDEKQAAVRKRLPGGAGKRGGDDIYVV